MRIPVPGETDLLVPLQDGVFEQPIWQTFLSRLRAATGAAQALIVVMGDDPDGALEIISGMGAEGFAALFVGEASGTAQRANLMRENRVYALEELVLGGGSVPLRFVEERMAPAGLCDLRALRLREPGGLDGWLALVGARPLTAAQGRQLTLLAPFFRAALRTFAALQGARARSEIAALALQRQHFGWIALDRDCCIVDMDARGEALLASAPVLQRGIRSRLLLAAPEMDRMLTDRLRLFAGRQDETTLALQLAGDPPIDMLVAPVQSRLVAGARTIVAIAYMSERKAERGNRPAFTGNLFGLTASEARLAWTMVQGLSITEAAAELGLTAETARNYSKKIYAKTGARGQADLVRLILTSVMALA